MRTISFWFLAFAFILLSISCSELKKNLPAASNGDLSIHDAGWNEPNSPNSHGKFLKSKNWNVNECASCHGNNFYGGSTKVSCRDCHSSYPHPAEFEEVTGHPVFIRSNGFPLEQCKLCHGNTYSGEKVVTVSCRDCHDNTAGPEECNTCHGNFRGAKFTDAAPPVDINRDTSTTKLGVGAHQNHLATGSLGKPVKCQECHNVPSSVSSPGHIDSPFLVQVVFNDTLAGLKTSSGSIIPTPTFHTSDSTCSNVYCHGYFTNGNLSNRPQWNKVNGTQAACGTCHGDKITGNPTPTGTHDSGLDNCEYCHTANGNPVASYDGSKWIINDTLKHINGKLNLFDNEQDF
ncbi:MAG: CxxxxCH/CxxCH domain-containing protein [Ignavibacteriales bacterium]|nr:CxxxxCH/CxxCH domain-containing protein [Ignavibacteriales bacterium]